MIKRMHTKNGKLSVLTYSVLPFLSFVLIVISRSDIDHKKLVMAQTTGPMYMYLLFFLVSMLFIIIFLLVLFFIDVLVVVLLSQF